jgi:hypothetical protein
MHSRRIGDDDDGKPVPGDRAAAWLARRSSVRRSARAQNEQPDCASSASNFGDFLERIPGGVFNTYADFTTVSLDVSSDNCGFAKRPRGWRNSLHGGRLAAVPAGRQN